MPNTNLIRILSLLVFTWTAAVALSAADVVTLKNGDRITGAIVKKEGANLTFKSDVFGVVTFPWDQVDSVKGDQTLNVVLPGDKTVQSKISTEGGRIDVGTQAVAAGEIVALRNAAEQAAYERMLRPGLLDLWTVSGSFGIAGTQGNAETRTFTLPISFARISNTSKTTAYFNAIRASALIAGVSAQTAQAIRGGWGYSRYLKPRLFVNGFNDYEYDRFQNLDLRVTIGGGLGYSAWKGEHGRLDLLGGLAWNRESFDPAPRAKFTRNSAEAYWGDDFSYKLASRTSLVQSYRMFNNLSTGGEYRQNFDIGVTTQLVKWLTWNAAFSDRYLTNPAPGRKKNDLLYTTGLGFTFAR
jgi:putative salt-induced outer membrane protein YdiY